MAAEKLIANGVAVLDQGRSPLDKKLLALPKGKRAMTRALEELELGSRVRFVGGWVFLILDKEPLPPESALVTVEVPLGTQVGSRWQVSAGHVKADGFAVLTGSSEEFVLDAVPAGSALTFSTACLSALITAPEPSDPVQFKVRCNGVVITQFEQGLHDVAPVLHRVELPASGAGTKLTFELAGPACLGVFFNPRVGPAVIGAPHMRPWVARRPNVTLLLADTYRADNMTAFGGDPMIAPNLNRWAEDSLRFTQARSPASWTLPSHAALFSGLYPHQAGVTERMHRLSSKAQTLAERFQKAGYRTVAITEGGWVSSAYGLNQGFEWFEQNDNDLPKTIAGVRSALNGDDGRPLFLFVHSYRAHSPYAVTDATRKRLGEEYAVKLDYQEAAASYNATKNTLELGERATGEGAEAIATLERLYRGASADLDVGFGALLEALEDFQQDSGIVVLTSDHGQSFGEHGVYGHEASVWDEEVRIPLCIRAPGLAPGVDDSLVSLVDLPRTLTELAGIDPEPNWMGRDISQVGTGETVLSYQCGGPDGTGMAWFHGDHKLIFTESKAEDDSLPLSHAYDLSKDASERENVAHSGEWVGPAGPQAREALRAGLDPLLDVGTGEYSAEQAAQLEALGYTGDDKDDD